MSKLILTAGIALAVGFLAGHQFAGVGRFALGRGVVGNGEVTFRIDSATGKIQEIATSRDDHEANGYPGEVHYLSPVISEEDYKVVKKAFKRVED